MSSPFQLKDRQRDMSGGFALSSAAIAAGVTVVGEYGFGPFRQTILKFKDVAIACTNALAYTSLHVGTFPKGRLHVLDCVMRMTPTTTTVIADTINQTNAATIGIGSAPATSITLATTMMNFMPGSGETPQTFATSATIDEAAAAETGLLAAVSGAQLGAKLDGTGTAVPLYFNYAFPTNTDIDADGTIEWDGHIIVTWFNAGVDDALTSPEQG